MDTRKILITGSSGNIGRTLCPFLISQGFWVRGFDIHEGQGCCEFIRGSIEDQSSLRNAIEGMDAVLHLAAHSDDCDFEHELIPTNVIGVFNVLEAARSAGTRRLILASSIQTVDIAGLPSMQRPATCSEKSPTTHYGLFKLWAEEAGRMYSRLYGMSVIAARLGWVARSHTELHAMSRMPRGRVIFLSHSDACTFFLACLRVDQIDFAVLYAVSCQQEENLVDMEPSLRLIGFEAKDIFPLSGPFADADTGARNQRRLSETSQ